MHLIEFLKVGNLKIEHASSISTFAAATSRCKINSWMIFQGHTSVSSNYDKRTIRDNSNNYTD